MTMKRAALGALAMVLAFNAWADWPEKPITLIVPYKAGGTTHSMSQVLSKTLGRELGGAKIVVKNMPGAGSAVGITALSRAKPDGYTIMFVGLDVLTWHPMAMDVKYKTSDFRLIAGISEYQTGLVATPDQLFKTLPELIEYSKTNALNVADMGGMSKAFIEYIAKKEGVKWTPIPTRGTSRAPPGGR